MTFVSEYIVNGCSAVFYLIKIGATMTDWICTLCGDKIRVWISLCKKCGNRRRHSSAILSQNRTKLRKLLRDSNFTIERFDKFILYANNIVENWKVLMEYVEKNDRRKFQTLKNTTITR